MKYCVLLLLLIPALAPGPVWASEVDTADGEPKTGIMVVLGLSLPLGSPVFNQDQFLGASIRAIAHRRLIPDRPELSIELEMGIDLMIGWYDGAIISFPVIINASYELYRSKNDRFSVSPFGGFGAHYHKVVGEIGGVDAKSQLRPTMQLGLNTKYSLSTNWAMNLRSIYTRSLTSNQVVDFAGMTIRSPDRYGYGSLLVMLGLSKGF